MILKPSVLQAALAVMVTILAAGCSSDPIEPTPAPQIIRVAITPAARETGLAVSTCAAGISGAHFEITEVYASQAQADLVIRLGEPTPASGFAAQIAREDLVVVIHPDNPAGSLTLDEVQQLFTGKIQNWAEIGGDDAPVQVWSPLPADETRTAFTHGVLENGMIATTAFLAPTPQIMADTIASTPNAIGFLARSWSRGPLTAILPGVSLPVLVVAESEPQGAARELVVCLQSDAGQELLSAFFPN
jgi:hypothetical protein